MVRGRGETQRHSEGQRFVDSKPRKETETRSQRGSERWGCGNGEDTGCIETETGQREGENVGTQRRLGTETERCRDAMRHVERDRLREAARPRAPPDRDERSAGRLRERRWEATSREEVRTRRRRDSQRQRHKRQEGLGTWAGRWEGVGRVRISPSIPPPTSQVASRRRRWIPPPCLPRPELGSPPPHPDPSPSPSAFPLQPGPPPPEPRCRLLPHA